MSIKSNDENTQNLQDFSSFSNKMKRYPFNGRSKYLIDKFYLIGYDYSTLKKLFIDNDISFSENVNNTEDKIYPKEFKIGESPSLLNEISNDYSKDVLDIDIIMEMIFPNQPLGYYCIEENITNSSKIIRAKEEAIKNIRYISEDINTYSNKNNNNINNNNNTSANKFNFNNNRLSPDKDQYYPCSYNVIFSSNPQSGNNSKKSINGFAHIFYKKYPEKKITTEYIYSFFVPVIFCIISEFPFYYNYYKLTRQIMKLFKQKIIEVPIEFTIQNILNFTLSPINNDVVLDITPFSLFNIWNRCVSGDNNSNEKEEYEVKNLKEIKEENIENNYIKEENIEIIDNNSFRKSDDLEKSIIYTPDFTLNKKKIQRKSDNKNNKLRDKTPTKNLSSSQRVKFTPKNNLDIYIFNSSNFINTKFKTHEEETTIKFEPIKFNILPGYPLIQYNLSKVLLNNFTSYDVIIIFIYTFLEKDVLFFSTNLELLSLTLNSYQNLNFPLNDEKYYFINACVSYDNYIKNNSPFVGSTFTTMVGINDSYNPKYINSPHKLKEHITIDLDNGVVRMIKDESNRESFNKNKSFFDMVKKICKNKEYKDDDENDKILIYREIKILNIELNKCKEKINSEFKNYNYIDYNENLDKINKKIQESFYRFINNVCVYLYQNLKINISSKQSSNKEMINIDLQFDKTFKSNKYSTEELYFLYELKDTMKCESFIYGFIQSYNPIDLYKIPLTFTEEFVSMLSLKVNINSMNLKYFELFDELYERHSRGRIDIDFVAFVTKYFEKYKKIFDRHVYDYAMKETEIKSKFIIKDFSMKNEFNSYKYKWYELDNFLLVKYLDLLKNLEHDEYNQLFHFLLLNLEQNKIKEVLVSEIEDLVEKMTIKSNFLKKIEICGSNILLLFTLSLKRLSKDLDHSSYFYTLFSNFTIFRKYYNILMNTTFKLIEGCYNKKDYINARNYLSCYYPCINTMNNLVPNENLMNTIKKFNFIDIKNLFDEVKHSSSIKGIDSKNKKSDRFLNQENLFVCYNFNKNGIIPEKKIIFNINTNNELNRTSVNINSNIKEKGVKPKIKLLLDKYRVESEIYSQITILEKLTNEYKKFIKDLDENKINNKLLLDATMNIILFIRNINNLEQCDIVANLNHILFMYYDIYINEIEKKSSD